MSQLPDFFDIHEVRQLTIEIERLRSVLREAAMAYARLEIDPYDGADPVYARYQQARSDYAVACTRLVDAMHNYWPEFFCPF